MNILSGLEVREFIKEKLKKVLLQIPFKPKLSIVLVSNREDSVLYVKNKQKFGQEIGVEVEVIKLDENISENDLISEIQKLNEDSGVNGIVVQLPLPDGINKEKVLNAVSVLKDVDGLTKENQEMLYWSKKAILPATARAVLSILDFYKIEVKDKKVVVFGKSSLVGKPTAFCLSKMGAEVFVIDSKTENPKSISQNADIIVVAIGKPFYIDKSFIGKNNPVVIDVGINKTEFGLCGDVFFDDVKDFVSFITPVPKGVGPVTVVSLFQNLLDLCYNDAVIN